MLLCIPTAVAIDPDVLRIHIARVREAAARCGIDSEEKLALHLEMDRGQLHRQLNGDGHLSLTRLMKLPKAFWQHYGVLVASDYGMPPEFQRAAKLAFGLIGRKRQLRMAAKTSQRRSA